MNIQKPVENQNTLPIVMFIITFGKTLTLNQLLLSLEVTHTAACII